MNKWLDAFPGGSNTGDLMALGPECWSVFLIGAAAHTSNLHSIKDDHRECPLVIKQLLYIHYSPLTVTPSCENGGSIVIIPIIGKQTISAHSLTASHVARSLCLLSFLHKYRPFNNF